MNELEINDPTEEEKVCDICDDGTIYDDNQLLTCQKCGIIVHQGCYFAQDAPLDLWLCDVCERNLDPQQITCVICLHNGSALKMTENPSKWVHSLCGNWIPDVFIQNGVYNLTKVAPLRYKLGCRLCHRKGAIIQCSYGRCAISAHPWCAIKEKSGYTHRIVKNPEAPHSLLWEVFCKNHAHAVSEPVKPMVKAKRSTVDEPNTGKKQKGGKTTKVTKNSQKKKSKDTEMIDESDDDFLPDLVGRFSSKGDGVVKKRGRPPLPKNSNSTPKGKNRIILSDNESEDSSHFHSSTNGKQKRVVDSDAESEVEGGVNPESDEGFLVHNFSEWPGQAEGEPVDLPHIWNVISMMYPEDHSKEWIDFMLSVFELGSNNAILPDTGGRDDSFTHVPSLGNWDHTLQKLSAGDEDIINASSLTERDFLSLMDPDRRLDFDQKVDRHIETLKNFILHDQQPLSVTTQPSPRIFPLGNLSAITSRSYDHISHDATCHHSETVTPAHMIFNGLYERTLAMIQMRLKSESVKASDQWREVELIPPQSHEVDPSELYERYGIVSPRLNSCVTETSSLVGEYCLTNIENIPRAYPVLLPDRDLVSLDDESDEILSFMNRNMSQLQQLVRIISQAVKHARNLPAFQKVYDEIERKRKQELEWTQTITSYGQQRIWGYICRGLMRGIKDQPPDFNQAALASIPASWTIPVEGRPEGLQEDNDAQTDTVCMCCFDGITSEDYNKIIFCDGCNSSLHQMCYGIHEVPEGEYYCQRCLYIQSVIDSEDHFEPEEIKNLVVCCLCLRHHGGLKPTTDGRWVHMCCVFWAKDCTIKDLKDMSPIDISHVSFRSPTDFSRKNRQSIEDNTNESVPSTPIVCMICNQKSGYITQCCHSAPVDGSTATTSPCKRYFHPICAWFAGYYVETVVTDPTYLGGLRDGKYPSGVNFNFYCVSHTPTHAVSQTSLMRQLEQQNIRVKYRIDESDLSSIPGRINKKKRNKKKSVAPTERVSKNLNKIKELSVDLYSDNICAICMSPTHRMLAFHNDEDILHSEICSCSICHITVHISCLHQYSSSVPGISHESSTSSTGRIWKCDKCAYLESIRIDIEEKVDENNLNKVENQDSEIKCHLCPRRGGAFTQRSQDNKWVHYYCETHRPISRHQPSSTSTSDSITNKEKKHNCIYCNRKVGICVKCCDPKGCPTSFHPLCASRAGDAYLRIRGNIKEAFCKHHIPDTVYHLPNGYWVDLIEISNLRKSLDSARLILDLIKSREKVKKKFYFDQESKLDGKIQQSMRKLKKRLGISIDNEEDKDKEVGDVDEELEVSDATGDDHEDIKMEVIHHKKHIEETTEFGKRRGRPPKVLKLMNTLEKKKDNEDHDLPSPKSKRHEVADLPTKRNSKLRDTSSASAAASSLSKKVKHQTPIELLPLGGIDLSGQEITPAIFLKSNRTIEEYQKYMRDEFRKTVDETRATIGIFSSQRSYSEFQKQLQLSANLLQHKSLLDVVKEYNGSSEDLKYAKLQLKKQNNLMKQQKQNKGKNEEDVVESNRKKRRHSSIENSVIELEPETIAIEPMNKKTRRKTTGGELAVVEDILDTTSTSVLPSVARDTSGSLYSQTEQEFLERLSSKIEAPTFDQFSLKMIPFYDDKRCEGVASILARNGKFSPSAWNSHILIRLEWEIFHILNYIEDCVVPVSGPLVDYKHPDGAQECLNLMKKAILDGKNISIPGWWKMKSSSSSSSSPDEQDVGRRLINDYEAGDIDTVILPVSTLKSRLQTHQYSSFDLFAKDFYEMLSSGRRTSTSSTSKICWDSIVLSELFQFYHQILTQSSYSLPSSLTVTKVESSSVDTDAECCRPCPVCSKTYLLTGYTREHDSSMDSTWQWICSECIPAIESKLIDCSVQIYWTSYSKYFRGSIDALDLVSHEHRVLYEDGEWEYVQLAKEDFFIQIPSNILEKLTKKDANKSTNSTRSDLSLIVPNSSLGVEQESDLEDKPANLKSNRRSTPRRAK